VLHAREGAWLYTHLRVPPAGRGILS
jgi:hypothetical protein